MDWIQDTTTYALVGLIWTIQIVHYPSFRFITANRFEAFHQFHTRRIGFVVAPLMLLELISAIWLTFAPETGDQWQWFLLILTLLIWGSTTLIQVPLHRRLAKERDEHIINKLVATNWTRTFLWSLKAIVLTSAS